MISSQIGSRVTIDFVARPIAMSVDKAVAASGTDLGDGLRRRAAAGTEVPKATPQPIDNKKLAKKVGRAYSAARESKKPTDPVE